MKGISTIILDIFEISGYTYLEKNRKVIQENS